MTDLHTTSLGEQGPTVAFCHGLFGQGKNWTSIAKRLATDRRVLLLDMPDHGRSAWLPEFDLVAAADAVAGELTEQLEAAGAESLALVGHSMGGKIAMLVALQHPHLVERLCVVDVSPVRYDTSAEFRGYMDAMLAMDLGALRRRSDADAALTDAVPNSTVRSFLLQNLHRDGDGWRWQPNLRGLRDGLAEISSWPVDRLDDVTPYDGRVLWVGGARSDYVTDDYAAAMGRWFPRNHRITVKGAGHWVHSEQPQVFGEVLQRFLGSA